MKSRSLEVVCFALVWGLVTACAHGPRETRPAIHKVTLQGASQVPASDTAKKILNTESPFYTLWAPYIFKPQFFDRNAWQADQRRVERYYQSEGYYQAEVTESSVKERPNGTGGLFITTQLGSKLEVDALSTPLRIVDLTLKVDEGKPTHASQVEVHGMEALPPAHQKAALAASTLKPGAIFREQDWEGVKERIQHALRELGYAEATVVGDVQVETTNLTARISMTATPGLRYHFGSVYVALGARPRVSAKRISDEAQGAIKKGAWYSETAMEEAQARVFHMGVFGAVKVTRAAPDRNRQLVPVIVDVREAPFHSLRLGFGGAVDPVHWEARATGEYVDRNFLGDLRKLTVRLKLGYAFLPDPYTVLFNSGRSTATTKSGPIARAEVDLEQPHFLARDISGTLGVEGDRDVQQAYNLWGVRPKVGLVWRPHPAFSITGNFNVEYDRLQGNALLGAGNSAGATPTFALGCATTDCPFLLTFFDETVEWDRRNDKFEPTRGYYLALNLQEGRSLLGVPYDYLRVAPEARGYVPATPKLTFAARVRLGSLYTTDRQPSAIQTRFFSGGNEMRGFGSRRLSPMLALPTTRVYAGGKQPSYTAYDGVLGREKVNGQTVAVGGNGLAETSLEVRYNLVGDLIIAFFFDTGLVTTCPVGQVATTRFVGAKVVTVCEDDPDYVVHNLQYAAGFGFRYRTPVGPVRLDFAYRLGTGNHRTLEVDQPTNGPQVHYPAQGTCFGIKDDPNGNGPRIPGSPEGPCSIQLSIGEAF